MKMPPTMTIYSPRELVFCTVQLLVVLVLGSGLRNAEEEKARATKCLLLRVLVKPTIYSDCG